MKRKKLNKKNLLIVIFILLILSGFIVYYFLKPIEDVEMIRIISGNISEDPLNIDGYLKADEIDVLANSILLIKDCNITLISTNELQLYSIQQGLDNSILYRPTTHDIIKNIFENYGFEVVMVKIVDLKDGTYFANMIVKQEDKILNLDIKPSDAIAIAVRINAPVYAKKEFYIYNKETCE